MAQGIYADGTAQVGRARVGLTQQVTGPGATTALPKGVCKVVSDADCYMRQNPDGDSTAATVVDEFVLGGVVDYTYVNVEGNTLNFSAGAVNITPMT